MGIRILIMLIFAGCYFRLEAAEFDTLNIFPNYKEVALGKYVRYLEDSTNQMTLSDFLERSSPNRAALRSNLKKVIALGYGQNQYWLSVYLENNSDKVNKKYLILSDPNLDNVNFYLRERNNLKDSVILLTYTGDNFVNGHKQIHHRNYVIPLALPPNKTVELIMQIKRQWEPVNFPVHLSSEYFFTRRTNNDNLFMGLYFGVHITFILLIITLFFFTRIQFYLIYFVMNIFTMLNIVSDTGIGLQYIWHGLPFVQKLLPYVITFGTILLHIYFIRVFFKTGLHFGRFNAFLILVTGLILATLGALITFALVFPDSNLPYQVSYVIINSLYLGYGIMIVTLCLGAYYQVRRVEILWVLLAASLQFINWTITIIFRGNAYPGIFKYFSIYELNFFPGHLSTPHITLLIILLEIMAVSVILALNYYSVIKENTFSNLRLQVLRRKNINAYIEGQEKERERLTKNIEESISEDVALLGEQVAMFREEANGTDLEPNLKQIEDEIQHVLRDLNLITKNFIPAELESKSLNDIVKMIFLPLKSTGIDIQLDLPVLSPNINSFSKVNLGRILQEMGNNILKHSKAKKVKVKIRYHKKMILSVEDDGVGLPDENKIKAGIGLLNISSRIEGLNGQVFFTQPENGKGTLIQIQIPMSEIS